MSKLPAGYELRDGADATAAHAFLTESYWAKGISQESVSKSIALSIVISAWKDGKQVGMARVLTDYTSLAYLNDVYVQPAHEGQGIAQAMLAALRSHEDLQGVGRWLLFTRDAQALYAKSGWKQYPWPERTMIIDPKVFPA